MQVQDFDACRFLEDFGNTNAGHGISSFLTAFCCAWDILIWMLGASEAGSVPLEPAVCRISSTSLGA